jgi:3-hydroxyacyl-[acyl-carrier-protein] dehydratase
MRWMWIDRVVELVPGQKLVAIKHVSLAEEHLHDHFPASATLPALPIMPASLIIEGMAQTAGILVGHAENFAEKVVLAKVSKAELNAEARPGDTLRYTAIIDKIDPMGASTKGIVELLSPMPAVAPQTIGAIDLMFSHLDKNMSGLEFPEHNFVFSESFRTLLRGSGIAMPSSH